MNKQTIKENVAVINSQLKYLSSILGRELTAQEQLKVLAIVDKQTPKDKHGNYIAPLFPIDYAWIIYKSKK